MRFQHVKVNVSSYGKLSKKERCLNEQICSQYLPCYKRCMCGTMLMQILSTCYHFNLCFIVMFHGCDSIAVWNSGYILWLCYLVSTYLLFHQGRWYYDKSSIFVFYLSSNIPPVSGSGHTFHVSSPTATTFHLPVICHFNFLDVLNEIYAKHIHSTISWMSSFWYCVTCSFVSTQ